MNMTKSSADIRKMTGLSIFTAIIVVLTILCNFIRFGPFSITLALPPIVIGSALYGKRSGMYLGFIFSLTVFVSGLIGWDGGVVMYLMSINALGCMAIIFSRGIIAGWCSGLVYSWLEKKNVHLGVMAAAIITPVLNTGLFIVGMLICFFSTLESWAGGQAVSYYIIVGLVGVNFIVELIVNLVLSEGITTIIKAAGKRKPYLRPTDTSASLTEEKK